MSPERDVAFGFFLFSHHTQRPRLAMCKTWPLNAKGDVAAKEKTKYYLPEVENCFVHYLMFEYYEIRSIKLPATSLFD
jgi:hypothetical protein